MCINDAQYLLYYYVQYELTVAIGQGFKQYTIVTPNRIGAK